MLYICIGIIIGYFLEHCHSYISVIHEAIFNLRHHFIVENGGKKLESCFHYCGIKNHTTKHFFRVLSIILGVYSTLDDVEGWKFSLHVIPIVQCEQFLLGKKVFWLNLCILWSLASYSTLIFYWEFVALPSSLISIFYFYYFYFIQNLTTARAKYWMFPSLFIRSKKMT